VGGDCRGESLCGHNGGVLGSLDPNPRHKKTATRVHGIIVWPPIVTIVWPHNGSYNIWEL